MRPRPDDPRLGLLTRLGHRLPTLTTTAEAAQEVAVALSTLDVSVCVAAVHADIAVIVAAHVPPSVPDARTTAAMMSRVLGMRVPIAGIESFRHPVQLGRPYRGASGAIDLVRNLAASSGGTPDVLRAAVDPQVVTVPVMNRDRVCAVISAWGPGCAVDIVPTMEAVAAMLGALWAADAEPPVGRFSALTRPRPSARIRRVVESLLLSDAISVAVQPIVRLHDASVIGYEALARFPPLGDMVTPDDLFAAATSVNLQGAVDLHCIRAALRLAPRLGDADLFVNVLIGTLLDSGGMDVLDEAVREAGVDPTSIVLEFSEREPVTDLARLQRIAAEVRARGFRIAVDDAGAGHASMRVIAELRPEFIKVDRSLIHAIDTDRARRALVVALLSFSGHIAARLVAEGIETQAEMDVLSSLGVMFGQGWLPGRSVLTAPIEGHAEIEVVDDAWFARQNVARTREGRQPDLDAPVEPTPPRVPAAKLGGPRRTLARALTDAARALQSEHDPLRIVGVMAELMTRVVPVSEMAIFAADYETHRMVPMFAAGGDREELLADSFSLDSGLTGWAFARGRPQNVPDTAKHPLARQVPGTPVVDESLLLIPLVAGEHKLGMINCWRLGVNQFSSRDVEAASLFAHIAAAAWRNAQLYAELLNAAMTDPLTRLYNSRWLRDAGARDLARAARDNSALGLLLIDLDHFKQVNDGAGHAAGDLVLQRVADCLRGTIRGADAVVRLGGEEFVALLQDCDADGAALVAEAIRVAVREITVPAGCSLPLLTASIGIAAYPEHARTLEELIAAADRAMYAAKEGGRDSVARAVIPEPAILLPLPLERRARLPASRSLIEEAGGAALVVPRAVRIDPRQVVRRGELEPPTSAVPRSARSSSDV